MKYKNLIRVVVLAAIFTWPAFETYRYYVATKALAESEQRLALVNQRLAQVRPQQTPPVMKASLKVKE